MASKAAYARVAHLSETTRIAVVEDNEGVREALAELLHVMGYACKEFENAEAFLERYQAGYWSCLITDLRMPGMNGAELHQRVRALESDLPVIVITSAPDAQTRARVLADGAEAYLCKPIADSLLLHHIGSALAKRGAASPDRSSETDGG